MCSWYGTLNYQEMKEYMKPLDKAMYEISHILEYCGTPFTYNFVDYELTPEENEILFAELADVNCYCMYEAPGWLSVWSLPE